MAVGPNRYQVGLKSTNRDAAANFYVLELKDALTHVYPFDAHLVTYIIEGVSRQPRLIKDQRHLVDRAVTVSAFFCDIDNQPNHAVWNDELHTAALAQYENLDVLRTAGVYHTRAGRRVVQPLARPIPVPEVELYLRRWLHELEAAGFDVDWSCVDWTRHYRLPNVRREGRAFHSPYMNLDRMVPIELGPIAVEELAALAHNPGRPPRKPAHIRPASIPWTTTLPPVWHPRVERLAEAIRAVQTEWHTLFFTLAGAMLGRGVPYEHLPLLCRAISMATANDTRTADREAGARTTVDRYLSGRSVVGYTSLTKRWPSVAAVLNEVLARGREAELRIQATADVGGESPLDALDAIAALEEALRTAPVGVTLVSADSGLGQLDAIASVAAERAAKPYASSTAKGVRPPPGSRTGIAMPNSAMAVEMVQRLRALGVPTRHLFGPTSQLNPDETPVCKLYQIAKPLVAGGQVMQWELCEGRGIERCEFYDSCTARHGAEGPEDARVFVGSHAMVTQLDKAIGKTGLLIIVELPELLETHTFTLADFAVAERAADYFVGAYGTALRPALMALTGWVSTLGELDTTATAEAAVLAGTHLVLPDELAMARRALEIDSGSAIECARAAPFPNQFSDSPPFLFFEIQRAKQSPAYAVKLGTASRVLRAMHRALMNPSDFALQVSLKNGERLLRITGMRDRLVSGLRRDGAVVVLGHGSSVPQADVIGKIVGYEPPYRRLRVADAAPITRTLLRTSASTRRRWAPSSKLVLDASLVTSLRAIMDWAREDQHTRRLAIVTFDTVALALEAALADPHDTSIEARWEHAEQYRPALEHVRERLGPILRSWTSDGAQARELSIARYGDSPGLAAIRDVDALATLGDPWPGRGAPEATAAFLDDPGAQDARGESECRAALEMAQSRLQPFERERLGRALHVGNILPGGIGWSMGKVEIRQHAAGRPRADSAMELDELNSAIKQLGSMSAAARALGCPRSTLRKYANGRCSIPLDLAERLRKLVAPLAE